MTEDPRYRRSHEAHWEGVPVWAPVLLLFGLMSGCSRELEYDPSWVPSVWWILLATGLPILMVRSLKLQLSRHRFALLLTVVLPVIFQYLFQIPWIVRDHEFERRVAEAPDRERHDDSLHYWPRSYYGGGGEVEVID